MAAMTESLDYDQVNPVALREAVAPHIAANLEGKRVQASRLVSSWRGDGDIDAWIVPIDPVPPAPFDRLLRIKYVRTIVTQLWYWPLLFRALLSQDMYLAASFILMLSVLTVIGTLLSDVLLAWLDPRIRYE